MVEPGTNQKFPEPIDTNMVSEIEAQQLPPELPLSHCSNPKLCDAPHRSEIVPFVPLADMVSPTSPAALSL
jgi:hypothetical protein